MTEKEKMQKQMLYDMDYTPRTLNEMIGVLFRKYPKTKTSNPSF